MKLAKLLLAVLFLTGASWASNAVFIAQNSAGANDGTSCANAKAVSYFNTSGNWSATPTGIQIGPNTTVHFCGTFTSTASAQGSGASGNVINILFESGANFTSPTFFSPSTGAINLTNFQFIVVNGNHVGVIQNPLNGSPGGTCPGAGGLCTSSSTSILIAVGSNDEVRNFDGSGHLGPEYTHSLTTDTSADETNNNAVKYLNQSNVTIDNNIIHDCGWCVNGWGNGLQIYNNEIYNWSHGVAFGPNINVNPGPVIHDNHIHDALLWDANPPTCAYHIDGIHLWDSDTTKSVTNVSLYNNVFDGDSGHCPTAWIYTENFYANVNVFNNLLKMIAGRTMPAMLWLSSGGINNGGNSNPFVVNNTFLANEATSSSNSCLKGQFITVATIKNNAILGCNTIIDLENSPTFASNGINNSDYEDVNVDFGSCCTFTLSGSSFTSLATWQAGLPGGSGQDSAALLATASSINLNSSGQPQSGSNVIGAALNLTSSCTGSLAPLCFDAAGVPRPNSAWDIGAYQFSGSSPGTGFSPTSLAYGAVVVGVPTPLAVTLTNTGTSSLTITSILVSGTNASEFVKTSTTCGGSLSASASCTVTVTFTPSNMGSRTANLNFTDNAAGSPQVVALTGTGTGMSPATSIFQ